MTAAVASAADQDPDRKASRIGEFRRIVATQQAATVDGIAVDLNSASHVVVMHDRLSPAAQAVFERMGAERMMQFAYSQLRQDMHSRSRRR